MFNKMFKDKTRLALKLFIILWFLLFLQVILKLTFNYWQPYVIPTPQLESISDFIDNNLLLKILIDGVLQIINAIIIFLCCIRRLWFKNNKQTILVFCILIVKYILSVIFGQSNILTLLITFILPLFICDKKFLKTLIYTIITFILSNLFLLLSLWIEGFSNVNDMKYIIKVLFQNDYYIMLVLNYILFNFIRLKKEEKDNGSKFMV